MKLGLACCLVAIAACSSDSTNPASSETPPGGPGTATPSPTPEPGSPPPGNPTIPPGSGLAKLGTLVVLGDSISDRGGVGPFYYDVLKSKLEARYGTLEYQRKAKSGSRTSALLGQIALLPATLPGPVAVAITSGGNDMKAEAAAVAFGTDGPARQATGNNVKAALEALLAPDRFGSGVAVHVFEANIYDASDGKGDYAAHGCAFAKGLPAMPTDTHFADWNVAIAQKVNEKGQTLFDLHDLFRGHGYASSPTWYHPDCTHPSSLGHDAIATYLYDAITTTPF